MIQPTRHSRDKEDNIQRKVGETSDTVCALPKVRWNYYQIHREA